ncbi:Asp-tRNA(Asn)/Glu-tRNA(Gln) amidotransferase subunit GatA [bacterium]|nr:Asp-tRNA(Asn)/Glu-tRNA(Gln) amidotransferase subunit GatA [bacterium]
MSELAKLTIHTAHQKLKKKEISATELTTAVLDHIEKTEPQINAFISICRDQAMAQAKQADSIIFKEKNFPILTGIPIAPKDIYLTKGILTTCASHILHNFVPPYNATVIEKCLAQNAVIVGKTNLDEFAMGSSTETSYFKNTKNPWDLSRIPGGSSGGSAAAVSADQCLASLGTDTGGSIRQPASLCSVVGLKPTYGRVSRYGTMAFASSLDQMGPLTKDVTDCAHMMNVISGHDEKDSTSIKTPVPDFTKTLNQNIKKLRIGVPKEFFTQAIATDVKQCVNTALKQLEGLGAELIDISLPNTEYAVATYYIIAPAEASANLARYDGVRFGLREQANTLQELYSKTKASGFGAEVKRRILIGTFVLSSGYYDAYYGKAQKTRTIIRNDFTEVFKNVDVIAGPVSPTTAFKLGEKINDPLQMYLSDILTLSTNLAGLPGMSVPCGFGKGNLPVGLQLIGKAFDEETLIRVAHCYEQATKWHLKKPKITT